MAVVINQFEVVPTATPADQSGGAAPAASGPATLSPAIAREIVRHLQRQAERAARVRAY